jgi:ATP-binding cassette subfamily B protein
MRRYWIRLVVAYRWYAAGLLLVAGFAAWFGLAVVDQIRVVTDSIIAYQQGKPVSPTQPIIAFFFYKLGHHGMYFLNRLLDIRYKPRLLSQLVCDAYTQTVGHSLHWFESQLSGDIASKVADFQDGCMTILTAGFRALASVAVVGLSVVFLWRIHPVPAITLGVFILIYMPVLALLMAHQLKLQHRYVQARQQTMGIVTDSLINIFSLKTIGNMTRNIQSRLMPALNQWRIWDYKTRFFDAWWVDNVDTLMITGMVSAQVYVVAQLYLSGAISMGGFLVAVVMTLNIHRDVDQFLDLLLFTINPAVAQVSESYRILYAPYSVADAPQAIALSPREIQGKLEFDQITVRYDQTPVLADFSLTIQPGERIGIVGVSGSGKTTVVKSLLRYFDVESGSIRLDGHPIHTVTQESLRASMAVIPQDVTLFHQSIADNLRVARPDATDADVIAACQQACIHDAIMDMPQGYNTVVGERGVSVSGGQRQRIAIARAILKRAPILILDEATSSLDTPTERAIQASIETLLETVPATVIAIAHRLSTVVHLDRIVVLHHGKIVESGTHKTLMETPNSHYQSLWGIETQSQF